MVPRPAAACFVALLLLGSVPACGSDVTPGAGSQEEKPVQKPPPAPAPPPKPAPAPTPPAPTPGPEGGVQTGDAKTPAQPLPGLPAMTGDREKDRKAVLDALLTVRTEWAANQKLLDELMKQGQVTNPDPAKLAEIQEKNAGFRARAGKLQEMLDKLRDG